MGQYRRPPPQATINLPLNTLRESLAIVFCGFFQTEGNRRQRFVTQGRRRSWTELILDIYQVARGEKEKSGAIEVMRANGKKGRVKAAQFRFKIPLRTVYPIWGKNKGQALHEKSVPVDAGGAPPAIWGAFVALSRVDDSGEIVSAAGCP